jgi:crotonobetainyl-CoA:carnitine CoA-transferase CaiB-like acyl-CoA transferase
MTKPAPFAGVRVLEISASIAGSYCGKMLADAGGDVVKAEPAGGDPMRRWSASAAVIPDAGSGALFGYLNAGKRSVVLTSLDAPETARLLADVDLVIADGERPGWDARAVHDRLPRQASTVVVSLRPFGLDGPYVEAGLTTNEFVLQAMCGSIGGRGWPGEVPLQAGGRIGEWVTGAYGAVAAAAALRRATAAGPPGRPDILDLSALEAMLVTMGGPSAVSASLLGAAAPAPGRSLELPSIVPTADGIVGFCTITAQQFADFLVMIGRPDLMDDADLASFAGRRRRRTEFLEMVHGWAATRTTDEIIELAAAMRIPVSPVGTPGTITEIDHFRERGVFVKNALGALQPRPPYRSEAFRTAGPGAIPAPGEHDGLVNWEPRPGRPAGVPADAASTAGPARPLEGLRVIDFTAFWAGPTATQVLAALGADVIKVEGLSRPDGMRFSGGRPPTDEQWWESGPVFLLCNGGKRDLTLDLGQPEARDIALRLIATADLVVENFSPRVMTGFGLDWPDIQAASARVTMVRMPAFGLDGPWRDRVGFAQTMEQASGMAWLTGRADGPPLIPRGVCDPIAGLHAAFASLAALRVRAATGQGMLVECTMVEAALNVAAEALLEASANGRELRRDGNRGPGASPQGVYRCAGDDNWVALAVLDDAGWQGLAWVLGRPGPASRPGLAARADLATEAGRRAAADELDAAISAWTAAMPAGDAEGRLRAAGVAAARVGAAAARLTDPQLLARGFWEPVSHPVTGNFLAPGLPFRSAVTGRFPAPAAAPTLGQHNEEILTGILGLSAEEVQGLAERQVIGSRPKGL